MIEAVYVSDGALRWIGLLLMAYLGMLLAYAAMRPGLVRRR
jgi:hypothetical protein